MKTESTFEQIAHERRKNNFVGEMWGMIRQKKKYWLLPLVIVILLLGVLVLLSSTAAAPFIYTLF